MKKLLRFLFLISTVSFAQYNIQGAMAPSIKSDWVILYKIEGARQKFVQNSKIKIDSIVVDGKNQAIGTFSFTLPKDAAIGAYRVTYNLEGAGFIDFIFNKENIRFGFHPNYPNQSVTFSESHENILYKNYIDAITKAQKSLDSIQVAALTNPNLNLKTAYKSSLCTVNAIQKKYVEASKTMYVYPFIKATQRNNAAEIFNTPQAYMSTMVHTFFDKIDFSNTTLLNSSFLIDKITDFVFFINYSDDIITQQNLYKQSINKVMSKILTVSFKKDVIEFLIGQFETTKNIELIDYLFEEQYYKLPKNLQDNKYIEEKLALVAAEVGRIAPDFSWEENDKTLKLSELNDAENYVLVFWSTNCSHCLKEIPELHTFLKENKKIKVVAFSLERNDLGWNNYKKNLPKWHHILGLDKWENKIARRYNIIATPSYFVLDANKKIIAKPDHLTDVKTFIEKL